MSSIRVLALALAASFAAEVSHAQEWTRFHGPNGTGVSEATTIPRNWSLSDINWRVALPGIGHSQPVLWGNKVFLTSALDEGNERLVICLDAADGKILWTKTLPSQTHSKHTFNSFASATPAVDESTVYVVFSTPASYSLTAYSHDGDLRWVADLGAYQCQHSCGASPIVAGDMVILTNEQDGPSSVVAFDAKTGKARWTTPRKTEKAAYATPCIYQPPGEAPQLISASWAHGIYALDLRTGKPIWEAPVFDKRVCSSPVFVAGNFFATCGSGGGGNYLVAIRPDGEGDVSASHVSYKLDRSSQIPYVPTSVTNGDLVFLWSDKGIVSCIQGSNGKEIWQKRVGGNYYGSPIRVRELLYCISDIGECVVLSATENFEEIARIPLGEGSHSTPAVAGGRMYLRTFSHLISIGGNEAVQE